MASGGCVCRGGGSVPLARVWRLQVVTFHQKSPQLLVRFHQKSPQLLVRSQNRPEVLVERTRSCGVLWFSRKRFYQKLWCSLVPEVTTTSGGIVTTFSPTRSHHKSPQVFTRSTRSRVVSTRSCGDFWFSRPQVLVFLPEVVVTSGRWE